MRDLSSRGQQVAALVILALLAALLWSAAVEPLLGWWKGHEEKTAQELRFLAAYRRAASSRTALQHQLDRIRSHNPARGELLPGQHAELIAAMLQNEIRGKIEAAAGEIVSIQVLPSASTSAFRKISIRVNFRIGTNGLPKAAYEIENSRPGLFLGNVSIQAHGNMRPSARNPNPKELSVQWDVFGYMQGSGS